MQIVFVIKNLKTIKTLSTNTNNCNVKRSNDSELTPSNAINMYFMLLTALEPKKFTFQDL